LMTVSFVVANTMTAPASVIILQYTSTFWIFGLSPLVLNERPHASDLWFLALAFGGVVIIFAGEAFHADPQKRANMLGLMFALGSGLFYGLLTLMLRKLRHADSAAVTVFNNLGSAVLLLVQIEVTGGEDEALRQLGAVLDACGVHADPHVALPGDERGAARLLELREAVPAGVNAVIAAAKTRVHPDIEKVAGDFVVPFERLEESLALYRQTFKRYGLEYAIWGHVSDGNLHPNVVPRSIEDVHRGTAAMLDIARRVVAMGGAPLAEHGVGRSVLKQRLLRELYGARGIEEMRAVKRALDPEWKLAAGVLFPEP